MEPRSASSRPLRERPSASHYLFAFVALLGLWLLLVGNLQEQEVIAGVIGLAPDHPGRRAQARHL